MAFQQGKEDTTNGLTFKSAHLLHTYAGTIMQSCRYAMKNTHAVCFRRLRYRTTTRAGRSTTTVYNYYSQALTQLYLQDTAP